jgi:hypothetical protein
VTARGEPETSEPLTGHGRLLRLFRVFNFLIAGHAVFFAVFATGLFGIALWSVANRPTKFLERAAILALVTTWYATALVFARNNWIASQPSTEGARQRWRRRGLVMWLMTAGTFAAVAVVLWLL